MYSLTMDQYGPKHVEVSVFKNIIVNLMTIVCICWLILQKMFKRLGVIGEHSNSVIMQIRLYVKNIHFKSDFPLVREAECGIADCKH